MVTQRHVNVVLGLALAYFAARLIFFALSTDVHVPPDEITHWGKVQAFAQALWIPVDSPQTYELGVIAHQPPLYYLLMGKLVHLNVVGMSDLLFLRLLNVLLATATVVYAWRWLGLLTDNIFVRGLFIVMLTNTLMFTVIGAAVSYDNLVNLLATAGIYHLTAFLLRGRCVDVAILLACIGAGALTKISFLPLAAALIGLLAILRWRQWRSLTQQKAPVVAWAAAIAFIACAGWFYGENLAHFGQLVPGADQVLPLEAAMRDRIFARDYIVEQYRSGAIDINAAMQRTSIIAQSTDRHDAQYFLAMVYKQKTRGEPLMNILQYTPRWTHLMIERTVGYFGHRHLFKTPGRLYPYHMLLALAAVMCVRLGRPRDVWLAMIFLVLFNAAVLIAKVNYPEYLRTGMDDVAVQGRYMFPVLAPLYGLAAYHLLAPWPQRVQAVLACAIGAWFIYGDLPDFLLHTTRGWLVGL